MTGHWVEHNLIWLPELAERVVKDIIEEDRIIRLVEYENTTKQVRYVFTDKNNLDEEEAIKNKSYVIFHAKHNLLKLAPDEVLIRDKKSC